MLAAERLGMLKKNMGFTLVELMVTISILGMLLLAVAPSVAAVVQDTRARGIAEHLLQGLGKARIEAIKSNRNVMFSLVDQVNDGCALSSTSSAWVVSMDSPQGRCGHSASIDTAPRIIQTFGLKDLAKGVDVQGMASDASPASAGVTFNAFGQVELKPGALMRIDVSHAGPSSRRFSIEVSPAGGIRLCDRAIAAGSGDPRACLSST